MCTNTRRKVTVVDRATVARTTDANLDPAAYLARATGAIGVSRRGRPSRELFDVARRNCRKEGALFHTTGESNGEEVWNYGHHCVVVPCRMRRWRRYVASACLRFVSFTGGRGGASTHARDTNI